MTGDFNDALGLIRTRRNSSPPTATSAPARCSAPKSTSVSRRPRKKASPNGRTSACSTTPSAPSAFFRPLVITSVFVGGPTDGHGHHQVSGQMAQEVFNAAADPKVFPEMGLEPWAPLKVWRARVPFAQAAKRRHLRLRHRQVRPCAFLQLRHAAMDRRHPPRQCHHPRRRVLRQTRYDLRTIRTPGTRITEVPDRRGRSASCRPAQVRCRLHPLRLARQRRSRPGPHSRRKRKVFFDGIDTSIAGIASLVPIAPAFPHSGPCDSVRIHRRRGNKI